MRFTRPRRWVAAGTGGALLAATLLMTAPVAATSTRTTLAGSHPSWANPKSLVSHAPSSNYLGFRVYLGWNNQAGLNSLLAAQQNPGSSSYRQWLTPAQFASRFGPTKAQANAVASWLASAGLTVDSIAANRHYVQAEGTVGRIQAAFGTTINVYSVQGVQLESPSADVTVPSSLAASISGVVGLDQSAYFVHPDIADAPPPAPFATPGPCSAYYGQQDNTTAPPPDGADISKLPAFLTRDANGGIPWVVCGYGPGQVQSAYGLNQAYANGVNGTGVTVGIIDAYASPTAAHDLAQFSANHGLPAPSLTQVVAPGTFRHPEEGKKQDPQGWYVEESLDLASVHSTAPGARIVFIGAPNNFQDLDAAMNHAVSFRLADIVTNSYGFPTEFLPPGFIKPVEQTLMQGAAEGMTITFSSGDNGDESQNVGFVTADYPASSPNVVSVGGTSLLVGQGSGATDTGNAIQPTTATPSNGTYGAAGFNDGRGETGWGTGRSQWNNPATGCGAAATGTWCPAPPGVFFGGAGGGTSVLFARPAYQVGVAGLPAGSTRVEPDVAMNADPNTGDIFGETFTVNGKATYLELRIGGTSLASPLFAGALALAVQRAGHDLGLANWIFYKHAGAFHDVLSSHDASGNPTQAELRNLGTSTTIRTLDFDTSLMTGTGWDNVTGLGSVNGWSWVTAIAGH